MRPEQAPAALSVKVLRASVRFRHPCARAGTQAETAAPTLMIPKADVPIARSQP